MAFAGKGKRKIVIFVVLNVILVVSFVLYGLSSDENELLSNELLSTQAKFAKTLQEYEMLPKKIENGKQNLSELPKERIQSWFNVEVDKDGY